MKTPKDLTNTEFVQELMEYNSPLVQLFVIEALTKWSEMIVDNEEDVIKELENTMIHGPSWVDAAKTVKEKLDEKYK